MLKRIFNLTDRVRLIVLAISVAIVLAAINLEIVGKERIVRDGATVLLRIAPRDPRSLLQGDYMALRYAMSAEVARAAELLDQSDGVIVIQLGELNEASFVEVYSDQQLAQGQYLLRYRKRGESVRLASDAYFFEEGSWKDYSNARFGEIRINDKGEAVLTGLMDENRERLGVALH
jgi:uncharacterized membrane-anchored protein